MIRPRRYVASVLRALPILATAMLLAFTALMHMVMLPPMEARLAALEEQSAARAHASAHTVKADPAAQLLVFYRHFETGDSLPEQLAKLHGVAENHGISLEQGQYRLVSERDAKLRQYQVSLPIRASYPNVRRFIADALESLPVAALDQVTFERRNVDDSLVEARVQLTFFLPPT